MIFKISFIFFFFKYFSIGGERIPAQSSEMLRGSNRLLFENGLRRERPNDYLGISSVPSDNDGVFLHNEIAWGTHLINFEADHAELIGLGKNYNPSSLYKLIAQNLINI